MIIKIEQSLVKNKKDKNQLNIKDNKFGQLMHLYTLAMREVEQKINEIKLDYKEISNQELINHIVCRIKKPESIINKMMKKNYELTYPNLVKNVHDIAGVRVVCPYKSDIFEVVELIREIDDWKIIGEKDYVSKPKQTGYASYHMIVEVPVELEDTKLYTKVEIQIRTMAMDFWATLEHEIKYKSVGQLKSKTSKELVVYAKIINKLEDKFFRMHNKQSKKKLQINN